MHELSGRETANVNDDSFKLDYAVLFCVIQIVANFSMQKDLVYCRITCTCKILQRFFYKEK